MPASKDLCPVCHAAFFGRQKFLKCAGSCGSRFHLECIHLGETEYNFFMDGGVSSYKCECCVSAAKGSRGDDTPVSSRKPVSPIKKVVSPTRELNLPSLPSVDSLSVQVETVRLNSVNILDTVSDILEYVKSLQKEMLELKNENAALKIQMAEILVKTNSNVLTNKGNAPSESTQYDPKAGQLSSQSGIKKSYSKVLSENVNTVNSAGSASSRTLPHMSMATQQDINCYGIQANVSTGNQNSDGFQIVTRKRNKNREHRVGTLANSKLEMAPERIKTKSLFVSRFSPNVNKSNIEDSLKSQLNVRSLVVTKLKTKYQTYSSFHISVDERDFDLINNTNVWPAGCLIAPFFGKLKTEQHFVPATTSVSVESRVNAS